jgi:hypothetical protein
MASYNKFTKQVKERIAETFPDATLAAIDDALKGKRANHDDFFKAVTDARSVIENAEREATTATLEVKGESTVAHFDAGKVVDGPVTPEVVKESAKKAKARKAETKKAPKVQKRAKKSNFTLVAAGTCPHDDAKLKQSRVAKGKGIYQLCTKCQHEWYYYQDKETSKQGCVCITCRGEKNKKA